MVQFGTAGFEKIRKYIFRNIYRNEKIDKIIHQLNSTTLLGFR